MHYLVTNPSTHKSISVVVSVGVDKDGFTNYSEGIAKIRAVITDPNIEIYIVG